MSSVCQNSECGEAGKLKCSACASVTYCSASCQKKDWSIHKRNCKQLKAAQSSSQLAVSVSAPNNGSVSTSSKHNNTTVTAASPDNVAIITQKLQELKDKTHKSFQEGDFQTSCKFAEDALLCARKLPSHLAIGEVIQLQLNLTTGYIELKKFPLAESHSKECLSQAETLFSQNPNNQTIVEMLSMAKCNKAVYLLNTSRLDEALNIIKESVTLSEQVYGKQDIRLCKGIRILSLIQERLSQIADAERNLLKCYTISCLSAGVESREVNIKVLS